MKTANGWINAASVCFALVLTGCGTFRSVRSDYQSSEEFDRKIRCEAYAGKTEIEFREASRELGTGKNEIFWSVERVFYSSKRNSCICILRASSVVNGKGFTDIQILDVLTKQDLGIKSYSRDELDKLREDVDAQVKSLE
jgi:hypothetical protein